MGYKNETIWCNLGTFRTIVSLCKSPYSLERAHGVCRDEIGYGSAERVAEVA
jgi:hypothetical protein